MATCFLCDERPAHETMPVTAVLVRGAERKDVRVPCCARCYSIVSFASEGTGIAILGVLAGIVGAIVLAVQSDVGGVRFVKGLLVWSFILGIAGGSVGWMIARAVNKVTSKRPRLKAKLRTHEAVSPLLAQGFTLL